MNFNNSYIGSRSDIVRLVPSSATKMLDIGCSTGALGARLKEVMPSLEVTGIDVNSAAAEVARTRIDHVIVADMDRFSLSDNFPQEAFDCIVMADLLEHLKDPWRILSEAGTIATRDATIIICVPNVRHFDTLFNLVFRGYWPYRDRGIHDRSHLRFFTRKNLMELISYSGLSLSRIETNFRIKERPPVYGDS